jgi:hypothetical protein
LKIYIFIIIQKKQKCFKESKNMNYYIMGKNSARIAVIKFKGFITNYTIFINSFLSKFHSFQFKFIVLMTMHGQEIKIIRDIERLLILIAFSGNGISSHNKELSRTYFTFREAGRAASTLRKKLEERVHKRAKLFNKISSHGRKFPRSSRVFCCPMRLSVPGCLLHA